MDLSKLSAAKLTALHDKRLAASSAVCTKLIEAGYGRELCSETRKRAETTKDPLALEYVAVSDALYQVHEEMQYRRRWHGSLKPVHKTL